MRAGADRGAMADPSSHSRGDRLAAGTQASVPLDRLPDLLEQVQTYLRANRETYDREYERISGPREADYVALSRTTGTVSAQTAEQPRAGRRSAGPRRPVERDGRRLDRREDFETTLEKAARDATVVELHTRG